MKRDPQPEPTRIEKQWTMTLEDNQEQKQSVIIT